MNILNRIVTLTLEGLIYESDPRHAELMVCNFGLDGSKDVGTPGVKLSDILDEAPKDGGVDPWDDEPWQDSKPENDQKLVQLATATKTKRAAATSWPYMRSANVSNSTPTLHSRYMDIAMAHAQVNLQSDLHK